MYFQAVLYAHDCSCDLPATRKVCGFSNFNACKGCSKCLKEFPTEHFGAKPDYSGYDVQSWPLREYSTHIRQAMTAKDAKTASERHSIQRSYGCKYSTLLELPDFDVVRFHVVDPMHNLFLGLAKYTTKLWREVGAIDNHDYAIIQDRVDSMVVPSKVGRIPRKIASIFLTFTADEWKNWTLIYSVYALHGILPELHYRYNFVKACRILLQVQVSHHYISMAQDYLVNFCIQFQNIYGKKNCTPNMHMALHLKHCILDCGVLSSFWCFPYERLNGALEQMKKSWISPEKQMFTKFNHLQSLSSFDVQQKVNTVYFLDGLIQYNCLPQSHAVGSSSLDQTMSNDEINIKIIRNHTCEISAIIANKQIYQTLVPPFFEKCFSDTEFDIIHNMYNTLYPSINIIWISRFYKETKKVVINGEEYISTKARSDRSSIIMAQWRRSGNIDSTGKEPPCIGTIRSLIEHTIKKFPQGTSEQIATPITHVLAVVDWNENHPQRNYFGETIIVSSSVSHKFTNACYIPVS